MSSNPVAISLRAVSKRYGLYRSPAHRLANLLIPRNPFISEEAHEHWALHDISFDIAKGESVGIVGRNGSGKSTLLQIICGVLQPTSGELSVHGRIAALLELGAGFNPEFTGRENVFLNASIFGMTKEQTLQKLDDIMGFADIGKYFDQPVRTYSSGMLVRLAFAVQVQLEPDILIVDEALAVGDALFQKRCFQRINQLRESGVTILFVSHDQESVRTLTERAVLLNRGRMTSIGRSSEVLLEYRKILNEKETRLMAEAVQRKNMDIQNRIESASEFGDGHVRIVDVAMSDEGGASSNSFLSGEKIRIRVKCRAITDVTGLNVSLRIRNREGYKIYSAGTLNQDMDMGEAGIGQRFWDQKFAKGEEFSVDFAFDCVLGANTYELQVGVTKEEQPRYFAQQVLHWRDEAAFFSVSVDQKLNFFGGLVDLHLSSRLVRDVAEINERRDSQ